MLIGDGNEILFRRERAQQEGQRRKQNEKNEPCDRMLFRFADDAAYEQHAAQVDHEKYDGIQRGRAVRVDHAEEDGGQQHHYGGKGRAALDHRKRNEQRCKRRRSRQKRGNVAGCVRLHYGGILRDRQKRQYGGRRLHYRIVEDLEARFDGMPIQIHVDRQSQKEDQYRNKRPFNEMEHRAEDQRKQDADVDDGGDLELNVVCARHCKHGSEHAAANEQGAHEYAPIRSQL